MDSAFLYKEGNSYYIAKLYREVTSMKTPLEEASEVLEVGETLLMTIRQSHLSSISPARLFITDKRMIVVHHSFWGLYAGVNLLNTTKFSILEYRNMRGAVLEHGKVLSSLRIRVPGEMREDINAPNEWGIDGLWKDEAMLVLNYINDIVAQRAGEAIDLVTLAEANEIINKKGSKFVWLGVQNPDRVPLILGVDDALVARILPSDVSELSKVQLQELKDCILVDYNGSIAASTARFLLKEMGIHTYVLKGGISQAPRLKQPGKSKSPHPFMVGLPSPDPWVIRNTPILARFAEIIFGFIWFINGLLALNPAFISSACTLVAAGGANQPAFLQGWFNFWTSIAYANPALFGYVIAGLELFLGAFLILGLLRKIVYGIGTAYGLLLWSIPEGFGGIYSLPATGFIPVSIGTGIVYAFVFFFLALLSATYGRNMYTLDAVIEQDIGWWEKLAEIKHNTI